LAAVAFATITAITAITATVAEAVSPKGLATLVVLSTIYNA